jgi:hypothetical protein
MIACTSLVLNWNRREDTLACLGSLVRMEAPGVAHRVLLVDNGSQDDSVAAVWRVFPAVEVLALPQNRGYARGMNAGLCRALAAGAQWTLLVNNDAVVAPDLLARLLAAASPPGVGISTPTIFRWDDPSAVWPSAGWRRRLTLAAFDTTARPPSPLPYDVDWATGCCLLVRRAVWQEVGLFDEGFPFYYEDHDLCLRARAAGWRILHVPAAWAWHRVSASTGPGSAQQMYWLGRSSVRYYLKHTHGARRPVIALYRLGSLARTLTEAVLAGRPEAGRAYCRGLTDGWRARRRAARTELECNRPPRRTREPHPPPPT